MIEDDEFQETFKRANEQKTKMDKAKEALIKV
jgi:hypothetical protein